MTITTTAAMAINWLVRPLFWLDDVLRDDVDLVLVDLRCDELDLLLTDLLWDDLRVLGFLVTVPPLGWFGRCLTAQGAGAGWRSFGADC